jgi:hypothetical protein
MACTRHTVGRQPPIEETDDDLDKDDNNEQDYNDPKDPTHDVVGYNACVDKATGEWPGPDYRIPEICIRKDVIGYYTTFIHFNSASACAFYMDQCIMTVSDLECLTEEDIDLVCVTIIKKDLKTSIPILAIKCLKLLVYDIKHQNQTSRTNLMLTNIILDQTMSLEQHKDVEAKWDKKHKDPDLTQMTLDAVSAPKAFK